MVERLMRLPMRFLFSLLLFLFASIVCVSVTQAQSGSGRVTLSGHRPLVALQGAQALGDLASDERVELLLFTPNPKRSEVKELINKLYDPESPLYHKFLKPSEYSQRFSASPDDVAKLTSFAESNGLQVLDVLPNNSGIKVAGSAAQVGSAFAVKLKKYLATDGREFRASDADPSIPAELGGHLVWVLGLDSANDGRRGLKPLVRQSILPQASSAADLQWVDTLNVMDAYNLSATAKSGTALTGQGQTVALVEFEPDIPSDFTAFANEAADPSSALFEPFTNSISTVLIDGGATASKENDGTETDLDIDVLAPMIPNGSIIMYQGPNDDEGNYDTLARIASDDTAQVVSISWGTAEDQVDQGVVQQENTLFAQMATQGQTVVVASGDDGAYTDTQDPDPTVSDPASQPYAIGVGGTTLTTTDSFVYDGETTWNQGRTAASGGGVSLFWPIPSWQSGIGGASSSKRNVPDFALKADYVVPYIVYHSGWIGVGGTSAAAPLFAGFVALTNEARELNGFTQLGFTNPALYSLAKTNQATYFHDITSGGNWFYDAAKGYDDTTGWGSFKGDALLDALSASENPVPTPTPVSLAKPTKIVVTVNGGQPTISFNTVSGAKSYVISITNSSHQVVVPAQTVKKSPAVIHKKLKKGSYTLIIVAKNSSTTSANATKGFKIN